jgi:sodium transport system permease protein
MADKQRDAADVPVPIVGRDHAPELAEWLEARGVELVEGPEDPRTAVREGEVPFVLNVPADFGESFARGSPAKLELIVDSSRNDSRPSVAHIQVIVTTGDDIASRRLIARGVSPTSSTC